MTGLHVLATLTSVATWFLLCAGALVTSTGSGLAVPDWPLSYGQFFPPMVGGILYEHGHRLVAGFVAVLTTFQAVFFWKFETRAWVKRLAYFALAAVLTQAILGGLTVIFRLPIAVSVAHACLAQLFFCTTVVLSVVTSRAWRERSYPRLAAGTEAFDLPIVCLALSVCFFFQLLLGAVMRHTGAGLAIPDFPTVFGGIIPPEFTFPIAIHYAHRIGAIVVTVFSAVVAFRLLNTYVNLLSLIRTAGLLLALISIQVLLAALVIWMKKPVPLTTAHLAVGALCFATSVSLTVRAYRTRFLSQLESPERVKATAKLNWSPA